MLNRLKYITYNDNNSSAFIIFSGVTSHDSHKINKNEILGAGFVHLQAKINKYGECTIYFECYGQSTSLGIKSRYEKDSHILNMSKQEIGYISEKE